MNSARSAMSWLAGWFLLVTGAQALAQAPTDSLAVQLTGSWRLNTAASDDLTEILTPPREGGDRPHGGRGGPGGNSGGGMRPGRMGGGDRPAGPGGPFGAGDGDPAGSRPIREQMVRKLRRELSHLEIFMSGPELNITDGTEISRLLFCDSREVTIWTDRGQFKAYARREGETIVETWQGERGGRRTRCYGLSPDGKQLILIEQRPSPTGGSMVELRLVYDRES